MEGSGCHPWRPEGVRRSQRDPQHDHVEYRGCQFLSFLLQDLLIEEGAIRIQQTKRLSANADLPLMPGDTRLHLGVIIAVLVAVAGYILLFRSALGVRLRAVGHNPHASRYAGMPVKRSIVQALAFSGACSGIAGALLVFGSESHRLIGEGGAAAFTQNAGFNGIVAALFGGLIPSTRSRRRSSSAAC